MNSRKIGDEKENKAAEFLKDRGYLILERNYYKGFGEIDIIASKGDQIVFVEVKYRRNSKFGFAEEAVSKTKQSKIIMTAMAFLEEKKLHKNGVRFDVLAINGKDINWIKNSFWGD